MEMIREESTPPPTQPCPAKFTPWCFQRSPSLSALVLIVVKRKKGKYKSNCGGFGIGALVGWTWELNGFLAIYLLGQSSVEWSLTSPSKYGKWRSWIITRQHGSLSADLIFDFRIKVFQTCVMNHYTSRQVTKYTVL